MHAFYQDIHNSPHDEKIEEKIQPERAAYSHALQTHELHQTH